MQNQIDLNQAQEDNEQPELQKMVTKPYYRHHEGTEIEPVATKTNAQLFRTIASSTQDTDTDNDVETTTKKPVQLFQTIASAFEDTDADNDVETRTDSELP
eukprot:UN08246